MTFGAQVAGVSEAPDDINAALTEDELAAWEARCVV